MNTTLSRFCDFYSSPNATNVELMAEVYDDKVRFEDPAHQVDGLTSLQAYFQNMYANLNECQFFIESVAEHGEENTAFIKWRMEYSHPKIRSGNVISVPGVTYVEYGGKITYHRDYFDLGAMLYEHIPGVGYILKKIKQRMSV